MATPSEIAARLLEDEPTPDAKDLLMRAGDEIIAGEQEVDLNYHNAQTARHFYHKFAVYANQVTAIEARRGGATTTWKTRPGLFRIPIKVGYRERGYIDNFFLKNAGEWQTTPPVHDHKMPRIKINF